MTSIKQLCGIAVTALLISLTGCDKNQVESSIVGTWTAVSQQHYAKGKLWKEMNYEKQEETYYYEGEAVETKAFPEAFTLTMTEDGKYVGIIEVNDESGSGTEQEKGTYEVVKKGSDLYISYMNEDGNNQEMQVTALSDHLLKLQVKDEKASIDGTSLDYTVVYTFKR